MLSKQSLEWRIILIAIIIILLEDHNSNVWIVHLMYNNISRFYPKIVPLPISMQIVSNSWSSVFKKNYCNTQNNKDLFSSYLIGIATKIWWNNSLHGKIWTCYNT